MDNRSATEHLQVIRTLMERSAVYRRALAPLMTYAGVIGLAAAGLGWGAGIHRPAAFVGYWYAIALAVLGGAFLMVRRQAWKEAEPFWSPPTRRVAQALSPPLAGGFLLGCLVFVPGRLPAQTSANVPGTGDPFLWLVLVGLPLAWVILYGCALHAAGCVISRGIRMFGWALILGGCVGLTVVARCEPSSCISLGHGLMGLFFGLLHLACGTYLYFTEPRQP